jgi:hypothetical protein
LSSTVLLFIETLSIEKTSAAPCPVSKARNTTCKAGMHRKHRVYI